jgi:3-hydroxyisobutyryl-CoA hydrolase
LNLSFYLGLTGDRIKGKDLANCGLATHYVPLDKMGILKKEIIEGYYENNCYESLVQLVDKHSEIIFSKSKFSFPNQDIVERIFKFDLTKPTIDNLEELIVRLEQMAANSSELEIKWATQTLKILRSSSPLSIAITFEQIRRGLNIKSLEDAFNLESQLIAA